jgi:hypothetical protein
MIIKFFFIFTLALTVVGCLPTKPSDLKKDSTTHYEFEVDQPLNMVVERIQSRLYQCHVAPITASGKAIEVVDKHSIGKFEIYYRSVSTGGIYIIGALMTELSSNKTRIRVAYYTPWKTAATAVQRWVQDDYAECYSHSFSGNPKKGLIGFKSLTFEVMKNPKSSFDTVSMGLTQCLDGRDSLGKISYLVDSIYQKERNIGIITVIYHGFSLEYKMKVFVRKINDYESEITVYYDEGFAPYALPIEQWLNSGSRVCEI